MFSFLGNREKTEYWVRRIANEAFSSADDGFPGDEDNGTMSGWYVFSAMGFYPVTAGLPYYVIGSPLFEKVAIDLDNGKTFTVVAKNNSADNKYIQSATLNGKPYNKTYFSHEDLVKGGTLELVMGNRPCKTWGVGADAVPPSQGSQITLME